MPFEYLVGLRYTRSRRRNLFISLIALVSMIGIALGVATLIVVLSVMNGFQDELRSRILSITAHMEVLSPTGEVHKWQEVEHALVGTADILGTAPFISAEGLFSHQGVVQGALVRGILPDREGQVVDFRSLMVDGSLDALRPGAFGIVLGIDIAAKLNVRVGDAVVFIAPSALVTPAGVLPRLKRFQVVGIFSAGVSEYDSSLALMHLNDAQTLFRITGVTGVRLKLKDLLQAPRMSASVRDDLVQVGEPLQVFNWTQRHVNLFRAIEIEKRMMLIILTMIVAVAAFNVMSALVMSVTEKKADIAILRTMGASTRSIMKIFAVQGLIIGLVGLLLGVVGGVVLAINVQAAVSFLERLLHVQFLAKDVYYISELPSKVMPGDVILISAITLILVILSSLFPSWQASRIRPAETLRYE